MLIRNNKTIRNNKKYKTNRVDLKETETEC